MKKCVSILSIISLFIIVAVVGCFSIYVGACAANYLKDALCVEGCWCLALVPVLFVVAVGTELFIMLGMKRFAEGYNK